MDLLVVGGPTHMHGLATDEPGLRSWLVDLSPSAARYAAAFDTRLDKSPWVTGLAARSIARRLRRHGFDVLGTESFLVEDWEGPLEEGELDRARAWGTELARMLPPSTEKPVEARP